jgi:hypothetical protein
VEVGMRISEYIAQLQRVMGTNGDLEVETYGAGGNRQAAGVPQVDYRCVLVGKQWKQRFWHHYEPTDQRGVKVCRI